MPSFWREPFCGLWIVVSIEAFSLGSYIILVGRRRSLFSLCQVVLPDPGGPITMVSLGCCLIAGPTLYCVSLAVAFEALLLPIWPGTYYLVSGKR